MYKRVSNTHTERHDKTNFVQQSEEHYEESERKYVHIAIALGIRGVVSVLMCLLISYNFIFIFFVSSSFSTIFPKPEHEIFFGFQSLMVKTNTVKKHTHKQRKKQNLHLEIVTNSLNLIKNL